MSAENTTMLAERTDELLNRGRSQGFISTEDVADLLQEGELSATEVEEFYATLEEEAISIVEGEGAALPEATNVLIGCSNVKVPVRRGAEGLVTSTLRIVRWATMYSVLPSTWICCAGSLTDATGDNAPD